jgi:hypothetical protein
MMRDGQKTTVQLPRVRFTPGDLKRGIQSTRQLHYAAAFIGNIGQLLVNMTQQSAGFAKLKGPMKDAAWDALGGQWEALTAIFNKDARKFWAESGALADFEAGVSGRFGKINSPAAGFWELAFLNMRIGEFLNRVAVTSAAKRNAMRVLNMTEKEAMEYGVKISNMTNYLYGPTETPTWVLKSGAFGQLLYQYSSFAHKTIPLVFNMARKMAPRIEEVKAAAAQGKIPELLRSMGSEERRELIVYVSYLAAANAFYQNVLGFSATDSMLSSVIPAYSGVPLVKLISAGVNKDAEEAKKTLLGFNPATRPLREATILGQVAKGKKQIDIRDSKGKLKYQVEPGQAIREAAFGARSVYAKEQQAKLSKGYTMKQDYMRKRQEIAQALLDGDEEKARELQQKYGIIIKAKDRGRLMRNANRDALQRMFKSMPRALRRKFNEEVVQR